MRRSVLPIMMGALIGLGPLPGAIAATDPQLNFKIYSPEASTTPTPESDSSPAATPPADSTMAAPAAVDDTATPQPAAEASAPAPQATPEPAAEPAAEPEAAPVKSSKKKVSAKANTAADDGLKAETPATATEPVADAPAAKTADKSGDATTDAAAAETMAAEAATEAAADGTGDKAADDKTSGKTLTGYVRVVPKDTRIPIIMDTAVDSDTSQEGDEFSARTSEDLNIDGAVAVPAGSIIKGRIAQLNAPKHMDRGGSVALKFDTVTTPDNRQIPLVANLVAHGGVVHARRGLKDISIDAGTVLLPTLIGLGIGALAGKSTNSTSSNTTGSSISKGEAAMIGVAVGVVVGVAVLLAKKGKKVDVRPGDELKIQLAEDLRMPMM
ncbi:MAG: hypothetical protein P4L53_08005 [Candidatus Obscuribacterales bacterium]|nr:hypothetical protein [Candidatus Obscuribacterales bacterium]